MDRIKVFKPNKKKIIISIIATAIWYMLIFISVPEMICSPCPGPPCPGMVPKIINKCDCCFDLSDLTGQILYAIILPFVIAYVFISLCELSASVRKAYGKG